MSTTTVRLPEALKARIARVAAEGGMSAHSFIVEAVERSVQEAELRSAFVSEALDRAAEMDRGATALPWAEVRQYMLDRAAGKKTAPPRPARRAR
jgi:predicted transcriptional regulator